MSANDVPAAARYGRLEVVHVLPLSAMVFESIIKIFHIAFLKKSTVACRRWERQKNTFVIPVTGSMNTGWLYISINPNPDSEPTHFAYNYVPPGAIGTCPFLAVRLVEENAKCRSCQPARVGAAGGEAIAITRFEECATIVRGRTRRCHNTCSLGSCAISAAAPRRSFGGATVTQARPLRALAAAYKVFFYQRNKSVKQMDLAGARACRALRPLFYSPTACVYSPILFPDNVDIRTGRRIPDKRKAPSDQSRNNRIWNSAAEWPRETAHARAFTAYRLRGGRGDSRAARILLAVITFYMQTCRYGNDLASPDALRAESSAQSERRGGSAGSFLAVIILLKQTPIIFALRRKTSSNFIFIRESKHRAPAPAPPELILLCIPYNIVCYLAHSLFVFAFRKGDGSSRTLINMSLRREPEPARRGFAVITRNTLIFLCCSYVGSNGSCDPAERTHPPDQYSEDLTVTSVVCYNNAL
ncbi:hypothetical protein EVAR_103788_1 [Eumeta japonica]|uniref:Uncharacterized protein n=1 Tax=Eumeta variegata TaxID=151549 RepID=A0A4C1Z572_EUMVA|nr:hypothetical protein EVAR_103788_1 [Eumeta japonica]